jgi:transcription initiation factor IIE alpha subunit
MMGFITGIGSRKCDICKREFIETKGTPYNDYSCTKCDWKGKICESCASLGKCPKCGSPIVSDYEEMCKEAGGPILF